MNNLEENIVEKYQEFLRNRITQILIERNISEHELSLALGTNPSYINKITRGKTYPSMSKFFEICEYLDIEPYYFFETYIDSPIQFKKVVHDLIELEEKDFQFIALSIAHLLDR